MLKWISLIKPSDEKAFKIEEKKEIFIEKIFLYVDLVVYKLHPSIISRKLTK